MPTLFSPPRAGMPWLPLDVQIAVVAGSPLCLTMKLSWTMTVLPLSIHFSLLSQITALTLIRTKVLWANSEVCTHTLSYTDHGTGFSPCIALSQQRDSKNQMQLTYFNVCIACIFKVQTNIECKVLWKIHSSLSYVCHVGSTGAGVYTLL